MPLDEVAWQANPERLAALTMADLLEPPPPVDYEQWAVDHVEFGRESPFPGPYNPANFPQNRRIFEVLSPDHSARIIALKKSAQVGGTILAQIFLAAKLHLDPGPFLYTHPTEDNATRWARTKWRVMIRKVKALASILGMQVTRESGNGLLYQERKDGRGWLQVSGANSANSLSMLSVPDQVQDDLSKWDKNKAGDPEGQADNRSKAFDEAKILKISTPLILPGCRITAAFNHGTQEHWEMPCPECQHQHSFEWENFHVDEEEPANSHFICPGCGCEIHEHQRDAMVSAGQWVAHNPRPLPGHVSFYIWAAYSKAESWTALALAWIKAKGDPEAEKNFFNDWLGRAYEVQGDAPAWEGLRDRAEAAGRRRGIVPVGGLLLTLSMDCQQDRVECQLIAWGRDLRRWVVDYFVIDGHISEIETQARIDTLLKTEWPAAVGRRRTIDLTGIDGNAWTNDVWEWVRRWPQSQVIMTRGERGDTAPPIALVKKLRDAKTGKVLKYARRFFNLGVSGLKLGFYRFLTKMDPLELGFVDFPAGMGDDYFEQVTSERRVAKQRRDGGTDYGWVLPTGIRNEALDTMVIGEALAIKLGWRTKTDKDWSALEADREAPVAQAGQQLDMEDMLFHAPRVPPQPSPAPPSPATPPTNLAPARGPVRANHVRRR